MKKYSIVVADDERSTRERILGLLEKYQDYEVVGACSNGAETLQAIKSYRPDVIFLDIEMPLLNGFEVLEFLKQDEFGFLVFITAHDQYAVKAFENEALDYLLKPFDDIRFGRLMKRLGRRLTQKDTTGGQWIMVKHGNEQVKVSLDEILYLKSDRNHVQIHLSDKFFRKRISLGNIESLLDQRFYRIHRSFIVNESKILKMKHVGHGEYLITMANDKRIPTSKSYREALKVLLG